MAPGFTASADFAIDKSAGVPCPHLSPDCRCAIHPRLHRRGFAGCAAYDCFGAGQRICGDTFAGRDWRDDDETARLMFEAFSRLRRLHELLWHLDEALAWPHARALHARLRSAASKTEQIAGLDAQALAAADPGPHIQRAERLLQQAGDRMRAAIAPGGRVLAGADLIAADLAGADLTGADLRGAYLIGADLRDCDLAAADMMGADLRSADLRGARLAAALFLTRSQLHAARGDAATTIPARTDRPSHWGAATGMP